MGFFSRFSKSKNPPLIDALIEGGFLDKKNLGEIDFLIENTELELEDILLRFVSRENILLVKTLLFNNEYKLIDLIKNEDRVDTEVMHMLDREQMLEKGVLLMYKKDDQLVVAMDDPTDEEVIRFVEETTNCNVIARYITLFNDIRHVIQKVEDREYREQHKQEIEEEEEAEPSYAKVQPMSIEEFTLGDEDMSEVFVGVRPIVDAVIKQGLVRGASDIHIEPERDDIKIRFRIDGILTKDPKIEEILQKVGRNKNLHENMVNIIKNLSGESGKTMRLDESEKPQDGRIYIPEIDLDLRVSVIPTILGESVVIRIHYREIGKFTLDRLGFEPKVYRKFRKIVESPYGIILVAGPTGSGKTTTLYSVMQLINSPGKKTLTIEDPVEYSIPGANQAQINQSKNFTFDAALRAFLRHDPDIIMVGEIRDVETAKMAMEAALTGHMVLSSIHANDAITTVHRLRDLGVDPRLVTATCLATLGQRLVRRVCTNCKRPFVFSTRLFKAFEQYGIKYNPRKLVKGSGCKKCNQTGYHGRVGTFELLTMTYEIKEMFLKDAPVEEIFETARKQGMRSLLEDALIKVAKGITTEEEVWRVTLLEGTYEA